MICVWKNFMKLKTTFLLNLLPENSDKHHLIQLKLCIRSALISSSNEPFSRPLTS